MEKRHILICGERGAGKSTLIEELLAHVKLPAYGYVTRSTPRREDGFHSIYIYPAGSAERPRTEENHIGDCNGKERSVNPVVFETLGLEYLQAARPGDIVVMDEIGFMELQSPNFCQAVRDCLDGEVPVLAAVKARYDVPFLDEVRSHPRAELFELTTDTREELWEKLLPLVKAWEAL